MGRRPAIQLLNRPTPDPGWSRVFTAIGNAATEKAAERRRQWDAKAHGLPFFGHGPESVTFPEIEAKVLETEPSFGSRDTEKRRRARAKATTYSCLKRLVKNGVVLEGPDGYRVSDGLSMPTYLLSRIQLLSRYASKIVAPNGAPIWKKPGDAGFPLLEYEKIQAKDILVDWFKATIRGLEAARVPGFTTQLYVHVSPPRVYQCDRGAVLARRPDKDPDQLTDDEWDAMVRETRPGSPATPLGPGAPPSSRSARKRTPSRPRAASAPLRRGRPARAASRPT